ncbi:TRAP transporter substrate-binding protein [Pseudooceanicola sp. HF7]|uniref:TRAP transporter substrate-binding protein n=1 Tax=Pseudooceanicola sp. HF7 TaxID=2721560 RepID=UPI0014303C7F|nr:TRAP transporter substrate-binding protein [Pseudooceanicola sp. HF7]NIZ10704.1 TRAP transporter substrate-binding protein [Pseudooceanicola sp. HF7]
MTLFKTAIRGVAACAILAGSSMAVLAQDVTLKMHYMLPEQAIVPKLGLNVWADKVEAESEGRIKIQRFPSMQLGGTPPQLADQVVDGVADIIWTLPGYTPGRFPSTEVFELPFIAGDPVATSKAYWELGEKYMMEDEFRGMKMIALWVHGPGIIHSKDPVTSVEDLNGVKLRAPSRVTNQFFSDLGATPIGMPVPAVPEALSKGVIDATVIPWEVTTSLKIPELVNNHTEFPDESLYVATFIMAMNQRAYDKMPDDLKAIIDANSGLETSAFFGEVMAEGDEIGRALAVENGNNIIQLTPEQIAPWKEVGAEVEAAWIEEMDGKGIDGATMVEEAKALIKKHSTQ